MLLTYVVPVTAMAVCYSRMGFVLWGSRGIGELSHRQSESIRSKRKVRQCNLRLSSFCSMWIIRADVKHIKSVKYVLILDVSNWTRWIIRLREPTYVSFQCSCKMIPATDQLIASTNMLKCGTQMIGLMIHRAACIIVNTMAMSGVCDNQACHLRSLLKVLIRLPAYCVSHPFLLWVHRYGWSQRRG